MTNRTPAKDKSKPWHRKEWKAMREEKLGAACVQCGTTEGIMVLQHLWHPPSWYQINRIASDQHAAKMIRLGRIKASRRMACPKCDSLSIRSRQSMSPTWVCIRCNHRFEDPMTVEYYDKAFWAAYWKKYRKTINALTDSVAVYFHSAYMSGVGVVTMCRKCAFLWDEMGMHLCPECRTRYCHPGQASCNHCSPDHTDAHDARLTFEIDLKTTADIEAVYAKGMELLSSLLEKKSGREKVDEPQQQSETTPGSPLL
jgi:hypothetical protein